MPGVEVIVRPSVFPDIRPKVRVEAAPDDADAGRAVLTGMDGLVLDLNLSLSQHHSKQDGREDIRRYMIVRVFQTNPIVTPLAAAAASGPAARAVSINSENYVDVEMPYAIQFSRWEDGPTFTRYYRKPVAEDYPNGNVQILEEDLIRRNPRE